MAGRNMNERLKYLRKESKITQDQLAQFLSVDQSMITKLENGTRRFSIKNNQYQNKKHIIS